MDEMQHGREPHAVVVRRACKRYGSLQVLKHLDMSVKKGTIYGLLGASGCGKTTLLNCVVGRRQLDSGHVIVLGVTPGTRGSGVPGWRIGYMPQETCLYSSFTIKENMFYFGMLFGMKTGVLENRCEFLAKLLELPDSNARVNSLSGGQQRRVSFMVALLHDAELLILDEPTVGMDAILRGLIWDYLIEITRKTRKTIIITTHYIDETRQADTIGLIRNGCLLDETSPSALLEKYSCESLEEVFLSLSASQEAKLLSVTSTDMNEEEIRAHSLNNVTRNGSVSLDAEVAVTSSQRCVFAAMSASRIRALLYKNVLSLWRDVMLMLFVFGQCPVAVAIFYLAFSGVPSDLALAVVNDDVTSPSPTCLGLQPLDRCSYADLSCRYLHTISGPALKKEFYNSTEEALRTVALGKAWGALHFARNFSQSFEERIQGGELVGDDVLEESTIHTWLDMSSQVISWVVRDELYSRYREFSRQILMACDINPKFGEVPMKVFEPIYGTMEGNYLHTVAPGLLILFAFTIGIAISVWTVVNERVEGLLSRNIICGVTTFEIMLAYFLCMFVMICVQAGLVVVPAFLLFNFYNVGDLALVTVFLIAQGTCGLFYGFAISAFCNNEGAAIHIATGSVYPLILFSGVLWPVEALNKYLCYLSTAMPLTLPIKALRWILFRGWTFRHTDVIVGFLTTLLWMGVFFVVCVVAFRYKKL